jgi:hypothetical protein
MIFFESKSNFAGLKFDNKEQKLLWQHICKKSHVRLGSRSDFCNRQERIKQIENDVNTGKFAPHNLGFLSAEKSSGVPRFIPVLDIDTTCVYYACIRAIDKLCAGYAVSGTFGGWSLGGERRKKEEEEIKNLIAEDSTKSLAGKTQKLSDENSLTADTVETGDHELDTTIADKDIEVDDGSAPSSPYNKEAWVENWQQYWKVMALVGEKGDDTDVFISFDIANFYDTIDQVRLRRMLQDKCPGHMYELDVLEFLLASWNKALRFYQPSSKGLPMDMVGDMSRVLANFYLVEVDKQLQERASHGGGVYMRWADDMTIKCKGQLEAYELIYFAGEVLHDIGLNINAAKVKIRSKADFFSGWGFKIMNALQDENRVQQGVNWLQEQWNDPHYHRKETALKRAITVLSKKPELIQERKWALKVVSQSDGIRSRLTSGQMRSLIECSENKTEYATDLSQEIRSGVFTEPKAHLLRCLEQSTKDNAELKKLFEVVREELLASDHPIMKLTATHSPY